MKIIKIGNVELTREEAERLYNEKKYICSYVGIFQICYSPAQDMYYGMKVINHKGYARRGRFYAHTAEQINHVFGKKILIED